MDRVKKLTQHLSNGAESKCPMSGSAGSECPFGHGSASGLDAPPRADQIKPLCVAANFGQGDLFKDAVAPPVVKASPRTSSDPINWLMEQAKDHPDIFVVDRGGGYQYAVLSDVEMFEDVLTYDTEFGNPVTPNMSVNKNIFQVPMEQLERHEQNAIGGLRKYLLNNNARLADVVAEKVQTYMKDELGDEGEMDMRDFGKAIFWPMTEALFGDRANYRDNAFLWPAFEDIDNYFGKALKGRSVPEVEEGVRKSYSLFSDMVRKSKDGTGEPMGPVMEYYDEVTKREDPELTAKFSTAAFWGGSGNSVPSTVWAFGMVLADPEARRKAYAEVDGPFANEPNAQGHYDFDKLQYLTAALKETLRLKTYSIAWRQAQNDTVLTAKSGKKYVLPKGMLIGLHFAMRHLNPEVHPDPLAFRPERFLGTGAGLSPTINGHKYAWVPFSAGRHKCSGYSLAMLEIPVIMALAMRKYNMEIVDPLPGMDFKQAFGVVGPDSKPVRIRYSLRK